MSNLKYTNRPADISNQDALAQLALDLSWSWRHKGGAYWKQLNPELWEMTRNPVAVLQTVSGERLEKITSEPAFREALEEFLEERRTENESPRWFQQANPNSPLTAVAYFSMEYML